MTDFFIEHAWTESALDSIYVLYPNKHDRKTSLKRIAEALDRICNGEIDGEMWSMKDAIACLRQKTEEARVAFYGREKKWIPHSTTFYHQRRYLRANADPEELPVQLDASVNILASYPTSPGQPVIRSDVKAWLPALKAIDKALKVMPFLELHKRVKLYRDCVAEWSKEDQRFIPNAKRWFDEHRFNQDESQWRRNATPVYQDERDQIRRILNS